MKLLLPLAALAFAALVLAAIRAEGDGRDTSDSGIRRSLAELQEATIAARGLGSD